MSNALIEKNDAIAIQPLGADVAEEAVWFENFLSADTQRTYQQGIRQFCEMYGINSVDQFRSVTTMNVIQFRDTLKKFGKSPATINNRLSALSSLFNHLIEKQILQINPVLGIKRMKDEYHLVKSKCLKGSDVARLLERPNEATIKDIRDRAIFCVFFYTGTRVGALTKLKVRDFFEDNNYWVIDFQIKGGRRNRVAIHPEAKAAIQEWLDVCGYADSLDSPLFINMSRNAIERLEPISPRGVTKLWYRKCELEFGISGTSPHSARTTFITTSLDSGSDINDVKETAGHLSIRTTQSYYHRKKTYERSSSFSVRYG